MAQFQLNSNSGFYFTITGLVILLLFIQLNTTYSHLDPKQGKVQKICGVTLVAPPDPFPNNPMLDIKAINADWIALIPYAYTPKGIPEVHYGANHWQWWGETEMGIIENHLRLPLLPLSIHIHERVKAFAKAINP